MLVVVLVRVAMLTAAFWGIADLNTMIHLVVHLCHHAARGREEHDISDQIHDPGGFSEATIDKCCDVADAGEALQAVVESDEAVVTFIRSEAVMLHYPEASRRDGHPSAAPSLAAHAALWAALLSHLARFPAAAARSDVALGALVVLPVAPRVRVVQHLVPHVHLRAAPRDRAAGAKAAAEVLAAGFGHSDLERLAEPVHPLVAVVARAVAVFIILHGLTREAAAWEARHA